jgi:hypothetical protein
LKARLSETRCDQATMVCDIALKVAGHVGF